MDTQALIKNLHPLEIRVLRTYSAKDELTAERLQKELDYKEGHATQAFSWLAGKKLAEEVRREPHVYFEITDLGRSFAENGTNDERIISFLKENGPHLLPEIASALKIENKDVGSAFGLLSKEVVVGTFSSLFGVAQTGVGVTTSLHSLFTPLSAFSFMTFVLLYVPCLASIATVKQETNSWKWPAVMIAITIVTAYVVAFIIYNGGLLLGFS